ncbi:MULTISPECIES: hypothetical protein [Fusobacterium]|jgi:hypothetical protein|uniref:hypothetical protein n=1 Tax=Fusobacterium TaxID=848 RepID=UPI0002137D77|nr:MULTISPECIES: hypothetical protein [Fusobacterium]EGN63741.1 hypothetical protein HMPREF0404_01661 [Fusobacterium animalis 21_1A]ERT33185.1 hypothetical protein HMPREF1766_01874 [Fusobacterium nucleatum CTI-5]ERT36977.1 hypothetical protein HMPREF1540_00757 [Fusobacterium nucleatum CTI-3]OFQ61153.1 hypothetical protein HMPREF2931_04110 [Fusobacterium sp. HMSC065F01]
MNKEIYTVKVFGTFQEVKLISWLILGTIVSFLLGINAYKSRLGIVWIILIIISIALSVMVFTSINKFVTGKKDVIINVTDNLFIFPSADRKDYLEIPLNSIFGVSKENIPIINEKTGNINYKYKIEIHSTCLNTPLIYNSFDSSSIRDRLYLLLASNNNLR